jgi:aromatic ring-opening dioxygenase catalytic subunit (LigB family)
MTTQPTLFIPHGGGPCFFMEWTLGPADTWDKTEAYLRDLIATLPQRPDAILVITAHWEEPEFTVSVAPEPQMLFDYYGFPAHTYELSFPAKGSAPLSRRVVELLTAAGIPVRTDAKRGYDHGVFIPLLVAMPNTDIPVVTMSVKTNLDPEDHLALGKALAPLRDENVLIIGSGMSFHNMRMFNKPLATLASEIFDAFLTDLVCKHRPPERWNGLKDWARGPKARDAHPPTAEEHLLPLMVAAGAAGDDPGRRDFSDIVMDARISAYRFG